MAKVNTCLFRITDINSYPPPILEEEKSMSDFPWIPLTDKGNPISATVLEVFYAIATHEKGYMYVEGSLIAELARLTGVSKNNVSAALHLLRKYKLIKGGFRCKGVCEVQIVDGFPYQSVIDGNALTSNLLDTVLAELRTRLEPVIKRAVQQAMKLPVTA